MVFSIRYHGRAISTPKIWDRFCNVNRLLHNMRSFFDCHICDERAESAMEFLIAIVVLAGLIWAAAFARNFYRLDINPILAGGVGIMVVGTVFGPSFLSIPAGPIPITLDRLLIVGVVALFALRFLQGKEDLQALSGADLAAIAMLGILLFSTFTHDWSYQENLPLSRLLFFFILPVVVYFVTRNARLGDRELKMVLIGFAILGAYLSLTAFAETRDWNWAVYPSYIMSPEVGEFLGRGRGPLHNPIVNGLLIIIGTCATMLLASHVGMHQKLLIPIGIFTLVGCLGAFATLTRIVWLSLLVSLSGLIWSSLRGAPRRLFTILVIAGAIGVVGVAQSGALNSFKRDKNVTTHEMSQSAGLRVVFFVIAKEMFADKPITGHGFAQYTKVRDNYIRPRDAGNVETALGSDYIQHNIVLSFLTETGLLGALALLTVLATLMHAGWVVWMNPNQSLVAQQIGMLAMICTGVYFTCGMFQDFTVIPMGNMILFFVGGLASNLHSKNRAFAKSQTNMANQSSQSNLANDLALGAQPTNTRPEFARVGTVVNS